MAKDRIDVIELLRKRGMDGDVDFLREALSVLVDSIMDAEVSAQIGGEYGERTPDRITHRKGYRARAWDTRVGTMDLPIPKIREGSYFPTLLEPRRRSERPLLAVIQQAYVEGVSTRRVDDLVKALGCEGISKSQVSRICQELDEVVESSPRPLTGRHGLLLPVAGRPDPEGPGIGTHCQRQRGGGHGGATRRARGRSWAWTWEPVRTVLFGWPSCASLTARGLSGVELVTSRRPPRPEGRHRHGLWRSRRQRCRTHFMTNL